MSEHLNLMQQLETEQVATPTPVFAGAQVVSAEIPKAEWAGEEAVRLVQRVFLLQARKAPQLTIFAGIDHGSGTSEIAAAVADVLAQNAKGSVCLVESNFRSPSFSSLFGITHRIGLTDALQGDKPVISYANRIGTSGLWMIPAGRVAEDSPSLLGTAQLRARMEELRQEFEFVIMDAPPLTPYDDATVLGNLSDGLVLVLEANSTRREAAQAAAANLRSSQIEILAAVLNRRTFPIPDQIYRRL